jgi:HPt (histidine-containing phosphotransfer) domain-containing protein
MALNLSIPYSTAHKLAGGAAMLSYMSLAQIAHRFERAADPGNAEMPALAVQLAAAIETAVTIMWQELLTLMATPRYKSASRSATTGRKKCSVGPVDCA